jgi:hypothetical protein
MPQLRGTLMTFTNQHARPSAKAVLASAFLFLSAGLMPLPAHSASLSEWFASCVALCREAASRWFHPASAQPALPTGLASKVQKGTKAVPAGRVAAAPRDHLSAGEFASIPPAKADPRYHRFSYVLEGQASDQEGPAAGLKVVVRLYAGKAAQMQTVRTDDEGRYTAVFAVDAHENDPVTWSIDAQTKDRRRVALEGQRIAMREDTEVRLDYPVDFAKLTPVGPDRD